MTSLSAWAELFWTLLPFVTGYAGWLLRGAAARHAIGERKPANFPHDLPQIIRERQ